MPQAIGEAPTAAAKEKGLSISQLGEEPSSLVKVFPFLLCFQFRSTLHISPPHSFRFFILFGRFYLEIYVLFFPLSSEYNSAVIALIFRSQTVLYSLILLHFSIPFPSAVLAHKPPATHILGWGQPIFQLGGGSGPQAAQPGSVGPITCPLQAPKFPGSATVARPTFCTSPGKQHPFPQL